MSFKIRLSLAITVLVLSSLACSLFQPSNNKPVEETVSTSSPAPTATQPSQVAGVEATPTQEKTATTEPTQEPPTAAPTTGPEVSGDDVQVVNGPAIIQKDAEVVTPFEVQNPNTSETITDTSYSITIYDKDGNELKTDTGYFNVILPGQTIGIAPSNFIDSDQQAAEAKVEVVTGERVKLDVNGLIFTTHHMRFNGDPDYPKVTGVIQNNLSRDFDNMRVDAITYDSQGKINGGGFAWLFYLPANGEAGMEVPVYTAGEVASVEFYTRASDMTATTQENPRKKALKLVTYGFSQLLTEVSIGFVVENTDTEQSLQSSQYEVAIYDAEGFVLRTNYGYIEQIFPGEQAALSQLIDVQDGETADHVVVHLFSGAPVDYQFESNPLSMENAQYVKGEYTGTATGTLKNASDRAVSSLEVHAIAYNAAGEVIGGNMTYVDVPANGQTDVEIYLSLAEEPDHVELYPIISGITDFE